MALTYETSRNDDEITVPQDLQELVEKTVDVPRYIDPEYPPGMICDNLHDHLYRLVSLAEQLDLDEEVKSLVIRTIWIHDLPEIYLGDQTAVLKELGLVQVQDEKAVAHSILCESDWELYLGFEQASDFLKGKTDSYNEVGLIAKLLDTAEGNLYFHTHVRDWVINGQTSLPRAASLDYTFNQAVKNKARLQQLPHPRLASELTALIDWQLGNISEMWKGHEDIEPEIIREGLKKVAYN